MPSQTEDPGDCRKLDAVERISYELERKFPSVPNVTVEELQQLGSEGRAILVDVRSPEERAVSIIPGAITPEQLEAQLPAPGKVVIAYCTVGGRSSRWVEEARRRGIEAMNLRGSILAWTHAGGELLRDGEPTRRVHVAAPRWDLAADGYEPIW